jgi:hypothetical protein
MPSNIYNKGHYIQPGSYNYFTVKRTYDQKLELPYNNCFKNVSKSDYNKTIVEYLSEKKREYTQKECLYLFKNSKYIEMQPCDYITLSLDSDIIYESDKLHNNTISECVQTFLKEMTFKEKSSNYCPLEL